MSMLAEPRSRQKWSHDPRNTNWSNDKTKFGYQMLTKMGWSEGSGLGADSSGSTSHIKVNKRGSNAGVGLKKSHEDDWIAHQDDFNSLLSALNGNPVKSEMTSSVENKMKASKHRYTKFVKSKDLSNASSDDLACIFGQRGKSTLIVEVKSNRGKSDDGENGDLEIKTIESTLSMNEYFAKKMAALKQKQSGECVIQTDTSINNPVSLDRNTCSGSEVIDCSTQKKKKKKKKSNDEESPLASSFPESKSSIDEVIVDPAPNCNSEKKKKKKLRNEQILDPSPCSEPWEVHGDEICEAAAKKKKKKSKVSAEIPVDGVLKNGVVTKKKKKKMSKVEGAEKTVPSPSYENADVIFENGLVKKKKKPEVEIAENSIPSPCSENVDVVWENGLTKKMKKRKHRDYCSELVQDKCTDVQMDRVKKKKKKKKDTEMA